MNNSLKNTQITIKPELAELDGNVLFAEKMEKAKKRVANLTITKLEQLLQEAKGK